MATIFLASESKKGNWFPLGHKTLVIGRDEGLLAQVVDPKISRRHLQIRYDAELNRYWAADLNSANGVFVDGQRIDQPVLLRDEELIRIGDTLLFFTVTDFRDEVSALGYLKTVGERIKDTLQD